MQDFLETCKTSEILRAHTIQLETQNDCKFSIEKQPLNTLFLHAFPGQETKNISRYTFFKRLYYPPLHYRSLTMLRSNLVSSLTSKTLSWCSPSLPFVSPSPSCPKLFFPQECTAPESDTVVLWAPPAAIWASGMPFSLSTSCGLGISVVWLPTPSCPWVFSPQVKSSPPSHTEQKKTDEPHCFPSVFALWES